MFGKRWRGLAALEPLTGHYKSEAQPPFQDLNEPHEGDLQDLRNRLGLLVPPSLRFVDRKLHQMSPLDLRHQNGAMAQLKMEYAKSRLRNKPYYVDPYGRDRPGGPKCLMMQYRKEMRATRPVSSGGGQTATAQREQLQDAMAEAGEKRAEQRQKDGLQWGQGADDEKLLIDLKPQAASRGVTVSPHLYQPRVVHPKSEWTKNMEVAMALSRKKDVQDVSIRRLEEHKQHGNHVRICRDQKDSETVETHVQRMREKDERFAKFLKSKVKY